jgi:hypothetical protein
MVALVTGVAALVTMLVTDRPGEQGERTSLAEGDVTVPEIGDTLAQAGLGCLSVIRNEPPAPGDGATDGPTESALCSIGGTDDLEGPAVHALILVYDTDRDERDRTGPEPSGHALIYGDRWEVWVPAREAAEAVADALGGELELPDEFAGASASPPAG